VLAIPAAFFLPPAAVSLQNGARISYYSRLGFGRRVSAGN
jgi:hypothetical protein